MNKHYTMQRAVLCLLSTVFVLFSYLASAQTTFGGFINNDYFNAGNWSAGLPAPGNDGTIPGGATVTIGSALTVNFTLTSYGTINANAAVTVAGTGILNSYSGADFNIGAAGSLTNNGAVDARGSFDILAGGTFTNAGSFASTGSLVLNNAGTANLAGTFSNFGTINNTGTLNVTGGTVGNSTAINNDGTLNLNGGTLTNVNGATITNGTGKNLNHNTGATIANQGTLQNLGTYTLKGILTSNGTIENGGIFNNSIGGSLTNNFRINNTGTFNNNNQGNLLNEFEINNSGVFNNNFFLDNGATINNLAAGNFNNSASGDINNQFGSVINNAGIFSNLGEILSVGDIINTATFTNGGSIYTNTGGGIINAGNFTNNNLLNNLEEITNTGIFTNNAQLQNTSGGVFTNNGDLYNNQPARIANDYNVVNNANLYNFGTIENGVRVFNYDYFQNNGYLINIGDFLNDVTGTFENTATSTTTGSNGGVLENSNGGVFTNKGTLNNNNEIFNFECSSFVNFGIINNYYWWTNHSLFFNYGVFNELPYHQMNMDGGVEITGPTSSLICENVTVSINATGTATITGAAIAVSYYDSCSTLTLKVDGQNSISYTCADLGVKTVSLEIADRTGNKVTCSATVTVVDNTAPVFQNCPADVVVIATGTTTPASWTPPTATDNCGPVNVTSTHNPGAAFPTGTTQVSYNATDGQGNGAAPCEFDVIVVPPGECADVASVRKVTSTNDNCGVWCGGAYALTFGSGKCYTAGSDLLFIEYTNGTAQLVGSVAKGSSKGYVEIMFTGKATTAPAGSPKYELCVNSGAANWTYYTSFEGLVTLDDCRQINIKRYGPAFQMGMGGNLQDANLLGASGWFTTDNGATHGGDFNFRIGDAVQCHNSFYLEAECATVGSKWQVKTDANASNGKVLLPPATYSYDYPSTNTADLVTFNVNVSVAGNYRLFARTIVPNSDGDSYWVRVNGGNWAKWNSVNAPSYSGYQWDQVGNWSNTSCSHDVPVTFPLIAGANTIQFSWREPNACLDKIYLTLTGKKPTGLGGTATNCGTSGGGGTDPFDGKILCIKSRISGKSADIYGGSTANGTKLIQWDATGGNNQKFKFTKVGANTYTITVQHSNKCLDATSNCYAGSKVVQNTCDGTNSQKWTVEDAGGGYYFIKSVSSGLYFDVSGSSLANGTEIILWSKHGGQNQQWTIDNCTVAPAPCNKTALFVVGSTSLNSADNAIKTRLVNMGYQVTVVSDGSCNTTHAEGKGLIVISASVNSSYVNSKYRDVNIPVLTWESYLFDDMKMTGTTSNYHFGVANSCYAMRVSDGNHPIAQGSTGDIHVFTSGTTVNWGNPGSGASKIGYVPGNPSCNMVFTYDTGASMVGKTAPARRVGFFLDTNNAHNLTNAGWRLFDRAVQWASGCDLGINAEGQEQVLSLKAVRNDRMVELYWTNNTGFKNEFFVLEKSLDGINWEVLNELDAFRNEDQSLNLFQDIDLAPSIGQNQYRVSVTFLDGSTMASEVQVVELNDLEDFGLYPNPASTYTTVNLEKMVGKRNVTIQVNDLLGRPVDAITLDEVLEATHQLDLSQYEKGQFTVSVVSGGGRPVTKMLIISK